MNTIHCIFVAHCNFIDVLKKIIEHFHYEKKIITSSEFSHHHDVNSLSNLFL